MDEAMLAQILPEVHSIFSDEAVETDLASIKRIKKICADTKHIVANREMEIKDIVRALQSKVEEEEHKVENDSTVQDCIERLHEAATRKRTLEKKLEELLKEKEVSASAIEEIQREAAQIEARKEKIEKEMAEHIPVQKGMLALYVNVTNLHFDYEAANVKGVIIPSEGEADDTPRPFDLDPSSMSEFDLCNTLWDLVD